MRAEFRLLGGFDVSVDGHALAPEAWRRRDAAALVKLLALTRGHRLLRDQVLDALWPDLFIEQGAPRLHKAAHFARAALGHPQAVVLEADVVALFPHADLSIDVDAFDDAAAAASSDAPGTATRAVDLYRGDLLPDDLYEPWTEDAREQRRLRYLELLRLLGRWDRVLETDPLDEDAHLHLVTEHLRRGDRRAALLQLDRMEQLLERELGTPPSAAAAALRKEAEALPFDAERWEARAAHRSPVPVPATPTVGREREVDDVLAQLERHQVVTLLGPGGVGKTRLAIEVARTFLEQAGVPACYVDLTRTHESDAVAALLATSLGVDVGQSATVERALHEALGGRSLLLVLDNFEHVVDAAPFVGRIAQCSPDLRILVTSRARLRIAGEHVFDVNPLPVEEERGRPGHAVALFTQVASAVDPGFRPELWGDDVAAICRLVDGLPLALELAAGHVRTLPPPLLRSHLRARLGSPAGAARDLPERHRTIPATIDWSLQLLGEPERRLFVRLGVFSGPVPLPMIESVCSEPGADVVDALGRLTDQSLVQRTVDRYGEPQFGLLELMRERAVELLTGEEEVHVRDRHATCLADLLDDIHVQCFAEGPRDETEDARQLALMIVRVPEIRAAHAWAERRNDAHTAARLTAGLGEYWHREGDHAEGRAWVSAALQHRDELDTSLVARLDLAAGIVEWPRDPAVARAHWHRAVEEFRVLGQERYLAYTMALSAVTHVGEAERYDTALRLCDEAIERARAARHDGLIWRTLNMKGELARVHGDDDLALAAYEEGRRLAAAAHDDAHLAIFLGNLSFLAVHRGDHEEARRLGLEAVRLSWSHGRRLTAGWTLAQLAGAERGLGHPELSARLIGASDHALSLADVDRHPCDVPEYDRVVAGLREELGDSEFARLHEEGARLPLDDAVALALADEAALSPE